jgi:hypothetical protein
MTQPLGNCPGCGGEEPFEQVHPGGQADGECPDLPGECAEWACADCGAGVFLGLVFGGPVFAGPVFAGPVLAGADTESVASDRQSFRAA